MARMLGTRTKNKLPWSMCDCGCRAGSRARKEERRAQRRVEAQAWVKEVWG